MNRHESIQFTEALIATYSTFGQELSENAASIFASDLAAFELEPLIDALRKYRNFGNQFPPKISDIRRYITGSGAEIATKQWGLVMWAMRSCGGGVSVCFGDRLTHTAIERMGGWNFICTQPDAQQVHNDGKFSKIYQELMINPPEQHSRKLLGLEEMQNASFVGIKRRPVRLVGRTDKEFTRAAGVFYRGIGGPESLSELAPRDIKYFPQEIAAQFKLQHEQSGPAAIAAPKQSPADKALAEIMERQATEGLSPMQQRLAAIQASRDIGSKLSMSRAGSSLEREAKAAQQAKSDRAAKQAVASLVNNYQSGGAK